MHEPDRNRTTITRSPIRQRCLEEAHSGMRNKQCQLEPADHSGVARWLQQRGTGRNMRQNSIDSCAWCEGVAVGILDTSPLDAFWSKIAKFRCGADLSRRSLAVRLSAILQARDPAPSWHH